MIWASEQRKRLAQSRAFPGSFSGDTVARACARESKKRAGLEHEHVSTSTSTSTSTRVGRGERRRRSSVFGFFWIQKWKRCPTPSTFSKQQKISKNKKNVGNSSGLGNCVSSEQKYFIIICSPPTVLVCHPCSSLICISKQLYHKTFFMYMM